MEGYYTVTEAAEVLGVSTCRVRQLVYNGTLPSERHSYLMAIPKRAVHDRLENRPDPGRPRKGEQ